MRRKARMQLIVFLLTITLAIPALAQPGSGRASSANLHRSTTELVSPATPPTGLYFDHVVTILLENQGVLDICNDSPPPCNANKTIDPFLGSLANNYTIAAQYLSLVPTSQPNYVALISGSMQGCTDSGCPSPNRAPNLVDRLESAGLTWRGYFENMTVTPGSCNGAENSPEPYSNIHNPFIVFQDITNNTSRCNKLVDANPNSCGAVIDCTIVNDLNNATVNAPSFMWLTPNDCNDMRGNQICNNSLLIQPGDAYLSRLVPLILTSRTFTTTRSALFITFDEGNGFCPGPYPTGESCVYTVWAGSATKTHFGSGNLYNHYSFIKTIEANWNFTGFTLNDANANPMAEFFNNQPADFQVSTSQYSTTTPIGVKSNSTLNVASFNNFTGAVTITATSTPAGPNVTLTPASVTLTKQGTATSTLTFSTTATGTYSLAVRATSGSLTHNKTMTITVAPPDFAISTDPSSLTIGLTTSTATSPVTVNATGDNSFFEYSYLESSFNAKGLTWLFYEDSRSTCEHQTGCMMYTTTTNGTKWAAPTKVPVHITDGDFSVYTNGTSIFYARYNETSYDSTCGRNLQFRTGTLNTNRTITWQPEKLVAAGASNRAYSDDEIMVDSNGQAWIAYMIDNKTSCGGTGTQRPQIIHSAGTNYGSWTGNVTICVAVCHSFDWHNQLASLGNGQIYSLYWNLKFGIHGRLYNGTTWGPEETISTDTPDTNSWLFNSGTSIYAIYYDNNTETYNFATRSTTGAWTIKLIGTAETHTGSSFSLAYYALPDTASYDAKDNIFDLFYMNSTAQRIDQWSGQDSTWNKSTGVIATAPVPYADSISSFIQSNSTTVTGEIYYVSGTTSFTINSVNLIFTPPGNTASFTTTITGQNGFTTTVTLTSSITPTTGLSTSCNPSTITGGAGTSTCHFTSTAPGNYTVTLTGTGGSLAHNTTVTVRVVPFPDFTINASAPSPIDVGQPVVSTITTTAVNGFSGVATLSDTLPSGLACSAISPSSITGSGTASISCSASLAGNYTLTITGTSGSLAHSATVTYIVQDFTLTATPDSITVSPNSTGSSTLIVTALNGFNGVVGLSTNSTACIVSPSSVNGSGIATVFCSAGAAGNYVVNATGISGPISHTTLITIIVQASVGGAVLPVDRPALLVQFLPGAALILIIAATTLMFRARGSPRLGRKLIQGTSRSLSPPVYLHA